MKNYQFFVNVGDGEIATFDANNLEEAKAFFAESFPDDVDKIETITSDDGYEEIGGVGSL